MREKEKKKMVVEKHNIQISTFQRFFFLLVCLIKTAGNNFSLFAVFPHSWIDETPPRVLKESKDFWHPKNSAL